MDTMTPKACPPQSWRRWLFDGFKLSITYVTSVMAIVAVVNLLRIVLMIQVKPSGPLECAAMLMLLALPEVLLSRLCALAAAIRLDGASTVQSLPATMVRIFRNHLDYDRRLLVVALVGSMFIGLLAGWLIPNPETPTLLILAIMPSVATMGEGTTFPTRLFGGTMSFALQAWQPISAAAANRLSVSAWTLNAYAMRQLRVLSILFLVSVALLTDVAPLLVLLLPIACLVLSGIHACAVRDIFGNGYKVKATVAATPAVGGPRMAMKKDEAIDSAPA